MKGDHKPHEVSPSPSCQCHSSLSQPKTRWVPQDSLAHQVQLGLSSQAANTAQFLQPQPPGTTTPAAPSPHSGFSSQELPQTVTALRLPPRPYLPWAPVCSPRTPHLSQSPGPCLPLGCLGKRSLAEPAGRTQTQAKRRCSGVLRIWRRVPRGACLVDFTWRSGEAEVRECRSPYPGLFVMVSG